MRGKDVTKAAKALLKDSVKRGGGSIQMRDVVKIYPGSTVHALDDFNLDIKPGEMVVLLGGSGCGKSTALRSLAGLEDIQGGRIMVGGQDVTGVPVNKREMAMVFQAYSLFPHMNALENVEFGLEVRGMGKAERRKIAMEQLDEYPDIVIGCAGGGSNLGGLIAPFMQDKLTGKADPRIIAVEPASCPSLTRGVYKYDFCDTGKITPMAKMYTLGCTFKPSANHAGGLRYHGMSPILSKLYADKYMEAESYEQTKVFEAAVQFAKLETILPAPESAHAIRGAIDEALKCKETGETKTILFGLTGTGYFDMTAYAAYNEGRMSDSVPTDEELQPSIDALPTIPGIQE